jgi:hypothetical protein
LLAIPVFPARRDVVMSHIRRIADKQGTPATRHSGKIEKVAVADFDAPVQPGLRDSRARQSRQRGMRLDPDDLRPRPAARCG